jgi:protein-tyrosine phosphatase
MELGYVDIHSHIVYCVDDGAKTIEDSLAMLEVARKSGTTDIVATPHADGHYSFDPVLVERRIAELARAAQIRIYPGCDFHLQLDNIEDAVANPEKYTINHKCYLLVEFSNLGTLHGAGRIFDRLLDAGMVPVITHPERHGLLQRRFDDLADWIQRGCYVQVTAASHTGLFGRKAQASARELLTRGLTHFIASDAHDRKVRRPSLKESYGQLADEWGEDAVRPLFIENPRAAVEGEPLEYEFAPVSPKARKWYQFWS